MKKLLTDLLRYLFSTLLKSPTSGEETAQASAIAGLLQLAFVRCNQAEVVGIDAILASCPSASVLCVKHASASTCWHILTAQSGFASPVVLPLILHSA